uniref:Uncharacterized protein n=1 Tax=Setaria digitata TaxID=48799 RepID=A0A915PLG2_9BILA
MCRQLLLIPTDSVHLMRGFSSLLSRYDYRWKEQGDYHASLLEVSNLLRVICTVMQELGPMEQAAPLGTHPTVVLQLSSDYPEWLVSATLVIDLHIPCSDSIFSNANFSITMATNFTEREQLL